MAYYLPPGRYMIRPRDHPTCFLTLHQNHPGDRIHAVYMESTGLPPEAQQWDIQFDGSTGRHTICNVRNKRFLGCRGKPTADNSIFGLKEPWDWTILQVLENPPAFCLRVATTSTTEVPWDQQLWVSESWSVTNELPRVLSLQKGKIEATWVFLRIPVYDS